MREKEIALNDWKRIVDECRKARLLNIEMFGGDALLRPDVLFPLVRYASSEGLECDFVTNGLLLDDRAAREIVSAGTQVVYLSIDGVGEVHNGIRGVPNAFERAVSALRHLKSARKALSTDGRPRIVVNTTVSKRNVRELESLVQFVEGEEPDVLALEYVGQISDEAVQNSAIDGVLPDPYFVVQEATKPLPEEDAHFLKEWVEETLKRGRPRNVVLNTENIDVLSEKELSSGLMPWKPCYVCRTLVLIDPSGNVLCCPFFSNYHLGNVLSEPLLSIWGNQRHRTFIHAQSKRKTPICRECILTLQRNPGFVEALVKRFSQYWRRRTYGQGGSSLSHESRLTGEPC